MYIFSSKGTYSGQEENPPPHPLKFFSVFVDFLRSFKLYKGILTYFYHCKYVLYRVRSLISDTFQKTLNLNLLQALTTDSLSKLANNSMNVLMRDCLVL